MNTLYFHKSFLKKVISFKEYQKQPSEVFFKESCSFAKFTVKHLCQSLFFNKVAGLSLKKNLKVYVLVKQTIRIRHNAYTSTLGKQEDPYYY